jgi:hypothetical protein
MKRSHVLAALLAAFACSSLEAQTAMTAKIPFDFQIGSTAMPAGEYRIDYSNRLVTVRSKAGNHAAMALMLPESRSQAPLTWVLKFRCYGNSHFLAGIWGPDSPVGGALPKSGREKEVASRAQPLQPTAIALAGR